MKYHLEDRPRDSRAWSCRPCNSSQGTHIWR